MEEEPKNAEGNSSGESFSAASLTSLENPANLGSPSLAIGKRIRTIRHQRAMSEDSAKNGNRGLIDTAAPFESVKEAVSKFGGIADWKTKKAVTVEKRKNVQTELEKVQAEIPQFRKRSEVAEAAKEQVLDELDSTKKVIEELKLSLEKTETEEAQAKQDSELAQLRVKEMEQGIASEASAAAKAQVEVAKARHEAAVAELKSVKDELAALEGDYARLIVERETAITRAEEAVSASREIEKRVEDLTLELITEKESLELAHAAHLEAEELRISASLARQQTSLECEKELEQAGGELQDLNDQLSQVNDLKEKLDTASTLLVNLKTELASYMEGKLTQNLAITEEDNEKRTSEASVRETLALTKKELEEVKTNIEKAQDEVNCLRVAASSLKAELDRETEALTTLRQRGGLTSTTISSLEAELNRVKSELQLILTKESEARDKMAELPKVLQQAAQDSEQAKSIAQLACEELRKAKEEAEQAKAGASTMEVRLRATLKEIEAAKASERLALMAIKAMQESEMTQVVTDTDSAASGVSLPLEEYYKLSKEAHDAEELAKERMLSAIEQVNKAKKSESMSLEKLEAAYKEMDEKKESLRAASEMEDTANEGKLGVEQELRDWRAEHEQRRRVSDLSSQDMPSRSSSRRFEESGETKSFAHGNSVPRAYSMPNPEIYMSKNAASESKPRRKKSFFPRIVMFLARKKVQTLK